MYMAVSVGLNTIVGCVGALFYIQRDVAKIAELVKLALPVPLPSWEEFSSTVLRPLRVQMLGSVVVSTNKHSVTNVHVY